MRKIRTKMIWFTLAFVIVAAATTFGLVLLVGGSDQVGVASYSN